MREVRGAGARTAETLGEEDAIVLVSTEQVQDLNTLAWRTKMRRRDVRERDHEQADDVDDRTDDEEVAEVTFVEELAGDGAHLEERHAGSEAVRDVTRGGPAYRELKTELERATVKKRR